MHLSVNILCICFFLPIAIFRSTKERDLEVEKLRRQIFSHSTFDSFIRFRENSILKLRAIHNLLQPVKLVYSVEHSPGHLLFQIPEIESKRIFDEPYKLAYFENCANKDVLDLLEDLKLNLTEEQKLVIEIEEQANQIEMLQADVRKNMTACNQRLLRFGGITSQCLALIGYCSYGLIFKIGERQERGIDPCRFADALENEMFLIKTEEGSKESCAKATKIEFEKYELLVLEYQRMLRATAVHFLNNKQDVSISKIVFDVSGVLGGLVLLVVFILNSFVNLLPPNIFRALIISGILIGVIGGVGNLISVIAEVRRKRAIILQFLRDSESVELSLMAVVTNMDELYKELIEQVTSHPNPTLRDTAGNNPSMTTPIGLTRAIKHVVTVMVGSVGRIGGRVGVRGLKAGFSFRGGRRVFVKLAEVGCCRVIRNILEIATTGSE